MPSQPPPPDLRTIRTSRLVAIVTGLIGFVLALATPDRKSSYAVFCLK
ncbi:arabinosyltransferase C, partial [Rhodococcus wratislaviensis IFP 2016]